MLYEVITDGGDLEAVRPHVVHVRALTELHAIGVERRAVGHLRFRSENRHALRFVDSRVVVDHGALRQLDRELRHERDVVAVAHLDGGGRGGRGRGAGRRRASYNFV